MKKLAMIGCGGIGSYHLSHFVQFKDIVELAGFCDLIPERAESFVQQAGCGKAFTNYIEMYDEIQPDMVFICIPPYCHGEIEFETIRRGIHFFVEKPLALDLDLARKIRDAAAEKNLITASGFQCRYSNLVEPNVKFCQENEVVFVDASRIGGMPGEYYESKAKTLEFCEIANKIGAALKPYGMKFTYHNHSGEFKKFPDSGDDTMMDILLKNTDPETVSFVMDTYWIQHGGGDVCDWIEKFAGRIDILHLKEMGRNNNGPFITEVGNGNIWWEGVLETAEKAGVKHYYKIVYFIDLRTATAGFNPTSADITYSIRCTQVD